jgi:phosphoribosylformimino-5-aminoimidazole carboxamide ribotide isomerase
MLVMPAIDLRERRCVQLVGGDPARQRVSRDDPLDVAREWQRAGFEWAHVVDLDAAMGRPSRNREIIEELLRESGLRLQVGGGIRSSELVDEYMALGAARLVVGTRALEDPVWLEEIAAAYPQAIVVAADVRERHITTHGWTRLAGREITGVLAELEGLPLAGVLVTAVHVEGQLRGPDLGLLESVVPATAHPVIAAGGIGSFGHLEDLAMIGVSAAIVGMALYTGAVDPVEVGACFGQGALS